MHNQIICLFVVFLIQTGNCITEYQVGDTLYIWAASGLNLRAAPNAESKVIQKIDFGEQVLCQESKDWDDYSNSSVIIKDIQKIDGEKTKTIEFKGTWTKVKYRSTEGYVFDAYLSKLKPLGDTNEFLTFEYFKQQYGILKYIEQKDSLAEGGRNRIVLGNGSFIEEYHSVGGAQFNMIAPFLSIEEAVLIIRKYDDHALDVIQKGPNRVEIQQEMGGYEIRSFENVTFVSGGWSC